MKHSERRGVCATAKKIGVLFITLGMLIGGIVGCEPIVSSKGNECASYTHRTDGGKPSKKSSKEKCDDIPSWARNRGVIKQPRETCQQLADRMLNEQYGRGGWKKGPGSEWSSIFKHCMAKYVRKV